MISTLGAGYAIVPVPPDWDPRSRVVKSPGSNVVVAHAGNYVHRTPHLVVREAEPGANWPENLDDMMFLPDGRLVPADASARDMFQGAGEPMSVVYASPPASGLRALVPAVAMFAGAATGYKLSARHPGWGAVGGAVVGGILGLIFR